MSRMAGQSGSGSPRNVIFATILCLAFAPAVVVCRQMCLSCSYIPNPLNQGVECVTDPENWAGGPPRIRCQHYCHIVAEFDAVTGDPTSFIRGCSIEPSSENRCYDNGARHSCFFTCEGQNYCNDEVLETSPLMDPKNRAAALSSNARVSFCFTLVLTVVKILLKHLWWKD